ncbi:MULTISPECIES: lipid IV(A) 3-deoxy-D-manno-octulosonic acid transferase [Rhodanobacter]|uniref:3-deoxy-D-manno-octulosonic acid transferase n=1 Tax=Rhodanobacter denitrificans TaxID=666685 RepID=I4WHN6_9GAMM|nr:MULTISPECIES: lipid IV(A) 3-deoxy-D-manno-octulosonic acid transferase [Rhodanobacter]AGG87538.1 3-deoxy-D-manno-octulosonic-acid transferase [Rhodanobacter denitrificans]EIL98977.1 3-deoxy-D-manno-octulosonic-acid transferase [Rhodanobacter denitrificans]UJJ51455.1 lipid IV(A) 3-deoxy-D-manno-octulosonic acid transferase [Rhodanobacter denitrificans]UJJ59763.1 lipid IV(A) 3-deoxy-D-manno-octulosonic acid transferase [Rhodanobacter denitrificans]UJM86715.1 lipid IV(A) 3-deoxy-D-manno-octulo
MRYLYTLAMYLATPLLVLRLLARGVRSRPYHWRWPERFGFFDPPGFHGSLWVHAVSVGEVNAAEPLIKALRRDYPNAPLVITTVTPTGTARVQQLFGDSVFHVYLPYDLPYSVGRFLKKIRPRLALIVETEIWPNLYFACRRRGIPLMIVNARLSERSLRGYKPLRGLLRSALRCVRLIAAQSRTDAARYRLLGADPEQVLVTGNMKFDMPIPDGAVAEGAAMRGHWGPRRPVWMAASTHEGEELAVLEAHLQVLKRLPDALLLLAPRHPERFKLVEHAVRSLGFTVATRSLESVPSVAHQVFVIDAMGQLMPFFAASDLAFVGGSLVPIGGHNVLEPAALSVPVLVGPHTFNFEEITRSLIEEGGAERVADAAGLGPAALKLLLDAGRRARMGRAAQAVFERERGAVQRVMRLIDTLLQE